MWLCLFLDFSIYLYKINEYWGNLWYSFISLVNKRWASFGEIQLPLCCLDRDVVLHLWLACHLYSSTIPLQYNKNNTLIHFRLLCLKPISRKYGIHGFFFFAQWRGSLRIQKSSNIWHREVKGTIKWGLTCNSVLAVPAGGNVSEGPGWGNSVSITDFTK